jgi:hypothetical protein
MDFSGPGGGTGHGGRGNSEETRRQRRLTEMSDRRRVQCEAANQVSFSSLYFLELEVAPPLKGQYYLSHSYFETFHVGRHA